MPEQEKERVSPVEYLRIFRDEYSDEIPERILNGSMPRNEIRYKVRRNWWNGVVGELARLRSKGLIPSGLEEEVSDFIEHYSSEEFHTQPLTTIEDIAKANEIITKIVRDK